MNPAEQARLLQGIQAQDAAIVDRWYHAIARTSFTALRAGEVRDRLRVLTERTIAILLAEPFEPAAAQNVGEALAQLGYVQPQALGGTLDVLGGHLLAGLPGEAAQALQPRLAAVLGAIAAGFFAACRDTILREQEQIRMALLAARRQTEEAQTAQVAAEAAVRVRDEVLSTVAHDLKNPLVSIKGQSDLLQRYVQAAGAADTTRILNSLERISMATTRMTRLLDELLDVTHLEAGQPLHLDLQPTDLVALARRAAAEAQQTTEKHRIHVDAPLQHLVCAVDGTRLERVLANLLSNAIKYSPAGDVAVAVRPEAPGGVVLEVRDRGQGIPADDLPHIFERFHRAANVGRIAGTGIGLWGARQIVEQHGGRIAVTSAVGQGTTVAVALPCAHQPKDETAP